MPPHSRNPGKDHSTKAVPQDHVACTSEVLTQFVQQHWDLIRWSSNSSERIYCGPCFCCQYGGPQSLWCKSHQYHGDHSNHSIQEAASTF